MSERRKPYPFDQLEPKWQARWEERRLFHAPNPGEPGFDPARPKYYVLDMFPYPSGSGLHVGHPEGYTATDIIARYKRFRGCNVLHPMGWDAFGLPAEQYAIKTGRHPEITTRDNITRFKTQLKRIGFSYDWEREVSTADPRFFRWTQWIFLQIYHSWFNPETQRAEPIATYRGADPDSVRLAYVAEVPVNWCPELGTVLANEEVVDGKSEVGGFPVVRRPMRQWMLRITAYAERLIDELEPLDWPEGIKLLQRNWIGKSIGAEVRFAVAEQNETIIVFTTRPDTLYGATYMVLAPENPLVKRLTKAERQKAIADYKAEISAKSDLERTDLAKDKSGVFTGAYALNPASGERIPIWIADYVLMGYGTGAIMGVPAHDERDLEFAQKFELTIREVVQPPGEAPAIGFIGDGVAINSPLLDGLPTAGAKRRITAWLEKKGFGRATINYKLRDWLFSRQRYWGEPFPIVWESGKHRAIGSDELPLVPPALDDFKPTGTGEPPLARATDWVRYSETATRELNTMPQWAGSCWYYLRFCDPRNDERFVGREAEAYWMGAACDAFGGTNAPLTPHQQPSLLPPATPVDATNAPLTPYQQPSLVPPATPVGATNAPLTPHQRPPLVPPTTGVGATKTAGTGGVDLYVGGTEHAVLHLLYARFWHKVLFDLGHLSTNEPFQRLVNQGMILGEDGRKMSKRWGNVIDPLDVIAEYGADAFRCYEMFMGPLEQMKPWSMTGVEGVARFLARVWRLAMEENQAGEWVLSAAVQEAELSRPQLKVIHATIKKVGEDIEALSFNTAIAQMMIFVNAFTTAEVIPVEALRTLLLVLNPFAPHLTSELWETVGSRFPISPAEITDQTWPQYREEFLIEDEVEIPLQVNGKVRDRVTVPIAASKAELEEIALANPRIREFIAGKTVRKIVVVEKKLVNVVAT
ncbi:MAG TPA: class I tRNA ligase family protein [Chthoniobacterales bacterium]